MLYVHAVILYMYVPFLTMMYSIHTVGKCYDLYVLSI